MNTFSSIESVFGGFAVKSSTASTPSSYTATGTYTVSQSGSVYTLTFTSGTGTLKIVSSNTAIVILVVGGGGGGGGSSQPATGGRGGAGGGGAGIAYSNTATFTSNSLYTITVGRGGAGGSGNATGINGTSSSFTGTGISYMSGNAGSSGGGGKSDNVATVGGIGRLASGGTTDNYTGGNGGYTLANDTYVAPGAAQLITINSAAYYSGGGTSGKINGGTETPPSGTNVSSSIYGYGGAGGDAASSPNIGKTGGNGVVIVKFTLA
jgi:hypothetical protein